MKLLTTLLFSCLAVAGLAQEKQAFKIVPEIIEQGKTIHINYNPAVNGVSEGTAVRGSLYLFKNFKWQGYDLPLVKSDSGYTAAYEVPKGTAMLACRFAIGDSIDRGGRFPYASVVYAADRKPEFGNLIEWGLLRSEDANGEMSPLVAKESLITPQVLVELWFNKEFYNPVVKRNLFFDIARGIKGYRPKERADSTIYKTAAELIALPDVTEKELISIEKVYRTVLDDEAKADALKANILAKYPKGLMHRLQLIKEIYLEMDRNKKVVLWDNFVKAYPFASFPYTDYVDPVLGDRAFFVNSYIGVANLAFEKHNLEKVGKLVNEAPFSLINYFYEHYVMFPFRLPKSPITKQEALSLSASFTGTLMKRIMGASLEDRGIFAPEEWVKQQMTSNSYVWSQHLDLLYNSKQYADALKFADRIKAYVGYRNIEFNTVYAKLLYHFGKNAAAIAYIVESIKQDTAAPEAIALLKADYLKSKGNTQKSFDAYYESLRPGAKLKDMEKRLTAAMVKIPATNFNLENLTGQRVELAQQKGKIVVLDLWASWCFPCKAAMPGMQMLVNKYESEKDVAFYFIATLEEDPNYKKLIHDFLTAKKYNFNVLYDGEDPTTKKMERMYNDYTKLLNFSGIPQKIIIDQQGVVRWTSTGFGGDLVELVDEVSFIIEKLKKEGSAK